MWIKKGFWKRMIWLCPHCEVEVKNNYKNTYCPPCKYLQDLSPDLSRVEYLDLPKKDKKRLFNLVSDYYDLNTAKDEKVLTNAEYKCMRDELIGLMEPLVQAADQHSRVKKVINCCELASGLKKRYLR